MRSSKVYGHSSQVQLLAPVASMKRDDELDGGCVPTGSRRGQEEHGLPVDGIASAPRTEGQLPHEIPVATKTPASEKLFTQLHIFSAGVLKPRD